MGRLRVWLVLLALLAACGAPSPAVVLEGGHGPIATLTADGAHVDIGTHDLSLRAVSIGRPGARADLEESEPVVAGPDVRSDRGRGVVEWWRALPSGLEHGLDVATRPEGDGELEVELELAGSLTPRLVGGGVALVDAEGRTVATYDQFVALDVTGARLPAHLEARGGRVVLAVDDRDARYPLVLDPMLVAVEDTIYQPAGPDSAYGTAVALSADGSFAAIGAPRAPLGSGTGLVYLFARTGTAWGFPVRDLGQANPELEADAEFGTSVALGADGNCILVGAPGDATGSPALSTGSARVFSRSGTSWVEEALLVAPLGQAGDRFGLSVALDATCTLALVGASQGDTAAGPDVGSAEIFARTGTTWSHVASLAAPDGAASDLFGSAVALAGDGSRALVGVRQDDTAAAIDAGSVRVFANAGTSWTYEGEIVMPTAIREDRLGWAVAVDGDASRAVIGMPGDDDGGFQRGSVRIFARSGTSWTEEATVRLPAAVVGGGLGSAVAISSDGSRALAGAPYFTAPAAAIVLARTATGWTEAADTISGGVTGDLFGRAVALSGDGTRAIVGSPVATATTSARARIFALAPADADGTPCSATRTCLSGSCVGGVCCDSACGGETADDCQACTAALTGRADGTCAPLSAAMAPTVMCRGSSGEPCDVPDFCSTTSTECTDGFAPPTTECRASSGLCDAAETCSGTGAACPDDGRVALGTVCRTSAGTCDLPEACDGVGVSCPGDAFLSGVECRASAGSCDPPDVCFGASADCPPDAIEPAGMVCRATTDATCDPAESCDGVGSACPADITMCGAPDAGGDGGTRVDGGVSPDAGSTPPAAASGCSCRVGTPGRSSASLALAYVTLLVAYRRRRSRDIARPPADVLARPCAATPDCGRSVAATA